MEHILIKHVMTVTIHHGIRLGVAFGENVQKQKVLFYQVSGAASGMDKMGGVFKGVDFRAKVDKRTFGSNGITGGDVLGRFFLFYPGAQARVPPPLFYSWRFVAVAVALKNGIRRSRFRFWEGSLYKFLASSLQILCKFLARFLL